MSDLDKIVKNVDYNQNFRKMSIWVKNCKYLDFGQNFDLVNIDVNLVLVKIDENIDFGKNCRKILILVNIYGKSRF